MTLPSIISSAYTSTKGQSFEKAWNSYIAIDVCELIQCLSKFGNVQKFLKNMINQILQISLKIADLLHIFLMLLKWVFLDKIKSWIFYFFLLKASPFLNLLRIHPSPLYILTYIICINKFRISSNSFITLYEMVNLNRNDQRNLWIV